MAEKDQVDAAAAAAADATRANVELKGAELQVGVTVEVFGLTKFAQYNGRHGVIKVCKKIKHPRTFMSEFVSTLLHDDSPFYRGLLLSRVFGM